MQQKQKRVCNEESSKAMPMPLQLSLLDLPKDIIINVLSRFPVKFLGRLKCVCKSWCSLIADSQFIMEHLKMSIMDNSLTRRRVFITLLSDDAFTHHRESVPFFPKSCTLHGLLSEASDYIQELEYPASFSKSTSGEIIGCCNGLVCMRTFNDHEFLTDPSSELQDIGNIYYKRIANRVLKKTTDEFLWNPLTRELKKLPNSDSRLPCYLYIYGFGYDHSTGDYKLVRVASDSAYETEVKVYTSRSNVWRTIQDFAYGVPRIEHGIFVNGSLHWLTTCYEDLIFSTKIVSFHLADETYKEVPQPHIGQGCRILDMGVTGGCLYITTGVNRDSVNLWIMKEYGVSKSWTKATTFSNSTNPPPVHFLKDGDVLKKFNNFLGLYNPEEDSVISQLKKSLCGMDSLDIDYACIHVESLVSPNMI